MKFTSEDLMKAMKLQVGDRVEIGKAIYKVDYDKHSNDYYFKALETGRGDENLYCVIDLKLEYQILPKPKRVGDLKCEEIGQCKKCTLQWLCNAHYKYSNSKIKFDRNRTLYQILASYNIEDFDVYKVFKDRLDKEVEENDKR